MVSFFELDAASEQGNEAINDDMGAAIIESQPLRGVISFGIMTPEELAFEIEKLK